MMSAIQLAIREIAPADTDEIIDLGAAATRATPVARWLNAGPAVRRREPRPNRVGIPSYLEANDSRNRYFRHGYVCQTGLRPDGRPLWTMGRSPMP